MFVESKCPKCGKTFIAAPQHALVDNKGKYCSCTCFIHRNDTVSDARRKAQYKVLQYTKDGAYIKTYDSARTAAELFGCSSNLIANCCRKGTPYRGFLWKYAKDVEKER